MTSRTKRRWLLAGALLVGAIALVSCRPSYLVFDAWMHDRHDVLPTPAGQVDDASRLNATPIAEVWPIPADRAEAEKQLQALLQRARHDKLPLAIAGAKHSMGGHTIARDGIVIDMLPLNHMEIDAAKKLLRVGAGARWKDIVPYLDARGLSVSIMQSNNDFSIGGSLSANCHGWQCQRPPVASSVESIRLLKADGAVVRCSRTENAELFSLALGGYGLFGVILEAELRVVPNERYHAETEIVTTSAYAERYQTRASETAGMAYGRLCVVPGDPFLKEIILTVFRQAPCEPSQIPHLRGISMPKLRREVFRAQIGSVAGKELRWKAEKKLGETVGSNHFSRNQLFSESADVYLDHNDATTDILHEYFIPRAKLEHFLKKIRVIVPRHPVDLLNVTVRDVREDKDSFLRYADQDMFGLVMLFNQERSDSADRAMAEFTREMIDAALASGGRYYLTYRLHATPEQFQRAYPQAAEFFAKKRQYDPDGIFRNRFYETYGELVR